MSNETVTIGVAEYNELLEDSILLNALRNAGVDNWEGWDYALEEYRAGLEEDGE